MSALRHAWLQKHPTPAAARGEFHWYPADGDRELRTTLVERMRGVDAPAVLWHVAPGRVCWAQVFAATAPTDGRRYTGLVLSVVERAGVAPAQLLAELALPPAAPYDAAHADQASAGGAAGTTAGAQLVVDARIARALLAGGDVPVGDPAAAELARRVAALEGWVPREIAATARAGIWRAGAVAAAPDVVAGLLAAACHGRGRARRAWAVLCELAAARGAGLDATAAAIAAAPVVAAGLSSAERAAAGPVRDVAALLHAWGRGRIDGAGDLPARLADAVALRGLALLAADRDPGPALAAARWHALLPAARRTALFEHIASRSGSLLAEGGCDA